MRKSDVENPRGSTKKASGGIGAWLRLVRIEHALMSAAGVAVGILLAQKEAGLRLPIGGAMGELGGVPLSLGGWMAALAVPFFINLASFALNDYFDIEADRQNGQLDRPLVSGALAPAVAIGTALGGYAIGIGAGWLLNPACGIVATLFALVSIAYNYKLKDWALVGNAYIALSMAIAFPFGAWAIGGSGAGFGALSAPVFWMTVGAFLAGLGRELVKSVQDMAGDQAARGSRHLPILIGEKPTLVLATICVIGYSACIAQLLGAAASWPLGVQALLVLSGSIYAGNALMLWVEGSRERRAVMLEWVRKGTLGALALALLAILIAVMI